MRLQGYKVQRIGPYHGCSISNISALAFFPVHTFDCLWLTFNSLLLKKYKTFSVSIYSYINTSGNWKNEKLCGNTTLAGRSVFTQFRVFPIFTSVDITVYQYGKNVLYFFYNIAQAFRTLPQPGGSYSIVGLGTSTLTTLPYFEHSSRTSS